MLGITPPYHSLQEMNLDWLLGKIKNMLRFLPDDGAVGQILRRTAHGAEWSDEQGGGGAVNSVNGQTGTVVLDAADVGALPDTTVIPSSTSDLVNDSGFITAAGAPVQSVNGQTGTVTISVPDSTSDLVNDSGFITAAGAPVQSVNGQTGTVTISVPDSTSDLVNDSGFITAAGAPVQSVNGQTGAVVLPSLQLANSWSDAVANGKWLIFVVGKGHGSVDAAICLTIPIASLTASSRYFQVGDAYNGGHYYHLQADASLSTATIHLYYGANIVSNESIEIYYI